MGARQGFTNEANTFGCHSAYISTKGMALAEEVRKAGEDDGPVRRPIVFD